MKLALLLSILLTGCATKIPMIVEVPKTTASTEIMASCAAFLEPEDKSGSYLLVLNAKNFKLYNDCSKLNEQKKLFINNIK